MATKKVTAKTRKKGGATQKAKPQVEVIADADPLNDLSPQQKVFALEYIKDWNGTRSAMAAGYAESSAAVHAHRLLRNDKIQEFISQYVAVVAMPAHEVLTRVATVARGSLEPFLYGSELAGIEDEELSEAASLSLDTKTARENVYLLKKAKRKIRRGGSEENPWTEIEDEIEILDRLKALELLGRHHKLWTDRVESSGPNGGPIETTTTVNLKNLNDDDLNLLESLVSKCADAVTDSGGDSARTRPP